MLSFILQGTKCTIDDEYNIECDGQCADLIKMFWEGILSQTEPSSPCPIDRMHAEMEELGANILHYDIEYVEGRIY